MIQVGLFHNYLRIVDTDTNIVVDNPKDYVIIRKKHTNTTRYTFLYKDGAGLRINEYPLESIDISQIQALNDEFTDYDTSSFEAWYSQNVGIRVVSGDDDDDDSGQTAQRTMHVFASLRNSNGFSGRGYDDDESTNIDPAEIDKGHPDIFMLDREDNWIPAVHPLPFYPTIGDAGSATPLADGFRLIGGMLPYAKACLNAGLIPDGDVIGIVEDSYGGVSTASGRVLHPDDTIYGNNSDIYNRFVDRLINLGGWKGNIVYHSLDLIDPTNDGGNGSYAAQFEQIANRIRTAVSAPNLPINVAEGTYGYIYEDGTAQQQQNRQDRISELATKVGEMTNVSIIRTTVTETKPDNTYDVNHLSVRYHLNGERARKNYEKAKAATGADVPYLIDEFKVLPVNEGFWIYARAPFSAGTWTPDNYVIEHSLTGANSWTEVITPNQEHTVTGLTNDTIYDVRIKARNSNGDGAWSEIKQVQPMAIFSGLEIDEPLVTPSITDVVNAPLAAAQANNIIFGNDPKWDWFYKSAQSNLSRMTTSATFGNEYLFILDFIAPDDTNPRLNADISTNYYPLFADVHGGDHVKVNLIIDYDRVQLLHGTAGNSAETYQLVTQSQPLIRGARHRIAIGVKYDTVESKYVGVCATNGNYNVYVVPNGTPDLLPIADGVAMQADQYKLSGSFFNNVKFLGIRYAKGTPPSNAALEYITDLNQGK